MEEAHEKRLIINADDFGYSSGRNAGIIHCIKHSSVTSVSILVNGSALMEVQELVLASADRQVSLGLHFNITEGRPLSTNLVTLTDSCGHFRGKFGLRIELEKGMISKDEVSAELRLQLKKFIDLTGIIPSHVDGHQHIHVYPGVRESFLEVLKEFRIKACRVPVEIGIEDCDWIEPERMHFFQKVVQQAREFRNLCQNNGLLFPDTFAGMQCMGGELSVTRLENCLFRSYNILGVKKGSVFCELMVHPGFRSTEPSGCGTGPDSFEVSLDRLHEINVICGSDFKDVLTRNDVRLCSYNELT